MTAAVVFLFWSFIFSVVYFAERISNSFRVQKTIRKRKSKSAKARKKKVSDISESIPRRHSMRPIGLARSGPQQKPSIPYILPRRTCTPLVIRNPDDGTIVKCDENSNIPMKVVETIIQTPLTSTKKWKEDPTPFDTPPDSEECSSVTSNSPDTDIDKRPKKIRKKKKGNPVETNPSMTYIPESLENTSLKTLCDYLEMNNAEIFNKLLPMCADTETRLLNGLPYETTQGVFIFKSYGATNLNETLKGLKQLVKAEVEDTLLVKEENVNVVKEECPKELQNILWSTNILSTFYGCYFDSLNIKCGRCELRFNKHNNGLGMCYYHPGRATFRTDGRLRYTCCNALTHMETCSSHRFHIYHHIYSGLNGPLEGYIPTTNTKRPRSVVGLDCEMVYTDKGFEVARVTVVDLQGNIVMDCFVRPQGIIYDLNTEFSGITPQNLEGAISFKKMQVLFTSLVSQYDIIVGHSIESDLQVMKIIHRRVIDTAIMYALVKHTVYMRKQSLKNLAKEYLNKDIQTSKNGHDSVQDATTTLSLVLQSLLPGRTSNVM